MAVSVLMIAFEVAKASIQYVVLHKMFTQTVFVHSHTQQLLNYPSMIKIICKVSILGRIDKRIE